MTIHNYFHADLATAAKHVGTPDVTLWYYTPDSAVPVQAKLGGSPPAGAVSAILATSKDALAGASLIVSVTSKDPIPPPPPPPPKNFSRDTYLADPAMKRFVGTISRGVGPLLDATAPVKPDATAPVTLDAYALVVQITGYPTVPLPEVLDADDLAAALRDPEVCGYPPGQVRVLKDHQATRAGMLAALDELAALAQPQSIVTFYYSGHGGQVAGSTYILPFDTNMADIPGTAISATELAAALRQLRAKQVLLVFDCCHAGALEAKDVEPLPLEPGLADGARSELVAGRSWALFAASAAGERSYVMRGARNGIFTKYFLAGLRGEVASNDEHVRVFGLFEYLQPRVVLDMPSQHPKFKCDVQESFSIARYRGGVKGVVPLVDDQFPYHALLSFAEADAAFVAETLLPALTGLRIATTSEELVAPELDRVLGLERGLDTARRTIVVLSAAYLRHDTASDRFEDFALLQRKHQDIENGRYSILPVYLENPDTLKGVPLWLRSLVGLRLGKAMRVTDSHDKTMARLIAALKKPLPTP